MVKDAFVKEQKDIAQTYLIEIKLPGDTMKSDEKLKAYQAGKIIIAVESNIYKEYFETVLLPNFILWYMFVDYLRIILFGHFFFITSARVAAISFIFLKALKIYSHQHLDNEIKKNVEIFSSPKYPAWFIKQACVLQSQKIIFYTQSFIPEKKPHITVQNIIQS